MFRIGGENQDIVPFLLTSCSENSVENLILCTILYHVQIFFIKVNVLTCNYSIAQRLRGTKRQKSHMKVVGL